jgi:hypothetical protein
MGRPNPFAPFILSELKENYEVLLFDFDDFMIRSKSSVILATATAGEAW